MNDTEAGQRFDRASETVDGSILNDQPTPADALGFVPYVEAVANFLTHRDVKPPLALSVEGDWGSGKSSFMMQLQEELREQRGARTVWFNAWRHDKEDALWAAFALEFTRQLAMQRNPGSRWWAHIRVLGLRFSWKSGWIEVLRTITLGIVTISILLVPLILLYAKGPEWDTSLVTQLTSKQSWQDILQWALASGGIAGYIAIVATLLIHLRTFVGNPLAISLKQYVESPSYESYVGLIDRFHEDFKKIVEAYAGTERVYVFVDDLDRCEVPKAADLMQALNLMISGDATQLIFIMGMDREKVAASVAAKHENLLKYLAPMPTASEDPATPDPDPVSGLEYGYAFVEKLVQLPFRVPQPAKKDVQRLLDRAVPLNEPNEHHKSLRKRLLVKMARAARKPLRNLIRGPREKESGQGEHGTSNLEERDDDPMTIRNIAEMVAPALDYNPRRFKQFMNLFRLRVYIAKDTGLFERRDTRKNPWTREKLGKFVAIALVWPRLIDSLNEDPNLLTVLQVVALGRDPENPNALLNYWAKRRSLLDLLRYEGPDGDETTSAGRPSTYSLENVDVRAVLQVSPRTSRLPEADLQEAQQTRYRPADIFALRKPTSELRPEDLGFQVVRSEEPVLPDRRPFYESAYVSRSVVPYELRADENSQPPYHEDDLAQSLQDGRGFVLIGPPLAGKTRTLYEVVRRLDGYEVLKPNPNSTVPDDEDLYRELEGQRVVLLLDDMAQYADSELDLLEFSRRLGQRASSWVVASTCRDGPELNMVRRAESIGLRRFYENIPSKLTLLLSTAEEKGQLARSIGKEWDPEDSENYPTIGSIIMDTSITPMRERFEYLLHEHPEQADVLRALQLLMYAGVLPYTQERLRAVLENVFGRRAPRVAADLDALSQQSFLRPGNQNPVRPEPAYLRHAVTYVEGSNPRDDFSKLADSFTRVNDYEGLLSLGVNYAENLGLYEQALSCFDRALKIAPDDPEAWTHKGGILEELGRFEEVLEVTDRALSLDPNDPEAWTQRGRALINLGQFRYALEATDEALIRKRDDPDVWHLKGSTLFHLGRWEKAIEAYDNALVLNPDYPQAWSSKGLALDILERYEVALEAIDEALIRKRDDPDVWHLKSVVLGNLGRHKEATEAYDEIRRLKSLSDGGMRKS